MISKPRSSPRMTRGFSIDLDMIDIHILVPLLCVGTALLRPFAAFPVDPANTTKLYPSDKSHFFPGFSPANFQLVLKSRRGFSFVKISRTSSIGIIFSRKIAS